MDPKTMQQVPANGTPKEAPPSVPDGVPQLTAEQVAALVPPVAPEVPAKEDRQSKTVTMRRKDLAAQVKSARAQGQAALLKQAGVASIEELLALKRAPAKPAPRGAAPRAPAAAPAPAPRGAGAEPAPGAGEGDRSVGSLQRENARLRAENTQLKDKCSRLAGDKARSEKRARQLQTSLLATQGESEIRAAIIKAGGTDVNYLLHEVRSHCAGLSDAELEKFDENKYLSDLKSKRGYLFGDIREPSTTTVVEASPAVPGAAPGAQPRTVPTPPAQKDVVRGQTPAPVDARSMTPAQYREHLKSRGFNNPASNPSTPASGAAR